MKSLLLVCALLLQDPAKAPAPARFEGTLAQGLKRIEELATAAQKDEALALSEQLLSAFGSRARPAIEYARGVVQAGVKEREPAGESFQHARADGAGALRLASIYNLGALALEGAEECYQKLPEVSGKQPPAAAAPGKAPPGPDALAEARKGYLAARERFVERLRAQWNDADTRADVELVQRRLKRLDEIEKKRKEEEQKKQKQQQDSKNDKDPKDKQDPQDKDKQDPDPKKDDAQDKDKQPDQQPAQDPKDKDKQDPKKPEDHKPDEQKPGEQQKPQPKDAQDPQLSKEEMTRLLDKLQQLEEQAAKLRAQIHKARRVAVKKDW